MCSYLRVAPDFLEHNYCVIRGSSATIVFSLTSWDDLVQLAENRGITKVF